MKKKRKVPYDKIILAFIAMMFLAGLFTPSVRGYANNASTVSDRDMQATIILENVVSRLERKGEIILGNKLTSDFVEEKINGLMGSIPILKQQDYVYCMNINTGKVNLKQKKYVDEIITNQIKGD